MARLQQGAPQLPCRSPPGFEPGDGFARQLRRANRHRRPIVMASASAIKHCATSTIRQPPPAAASAWRRICTDAGFSVPKDFPLWPAETFFDDG